jgi:two-component system sensor histidine kinase UhpB
MQPERFSQSLRFRITLAITLTLIVILGAETYWRYERHRQMDLEEAQTQVTAAGEIISASLQHALLTNDRTSLQSIVQEVSRQPGVRGIYLFDGRGALRLSSTSRATSRPPNQSEIATWLVLPTEGTATDASGETYLSSGGEQILRQTSIIANQPACQSCHASQPPVLGVLVSDFALTETNYQITSDLQSSITSGIATILAIVLAINFLQSRFVLGKLERFIPVLQRFGQGDLSVRLAPDGNDEIGQLAVRFNQMADGLQTRERENTRLYAELERKEAARAFLLGKVIAAQEEERKHLARELHDDFAQSLAALSVTVQSAVETIPAEMQGVHDRLARVQTLTQNTLSETSHWIQDLRPRMLDDLGLAPAIRTYAEARFDSSDTHVQIESHNVTSRLPPNVEITLFRVLQEALSNIARHAHARNVTVRIERYESGTVVAHVQDDGIGFIPARYLRSQEGLRGMGLLGMRERVELLDGTLAIDSTPGRGTRLRAEVPCPETALRSAS